MSQRLKHSEGRMAAVAAATALLSLAVGASTDASAPPDAGSGDPIRVGLFQPLAAAVGGFGQPSVDGAQLAVDEINAAGGIDGRPLELSVQDNACSSTEGVNAVQKLLSEEPAPIAIVGGLCSDPTLAAMPIVERNEVPMLVDLASNPEITAQSGVGGNDWVFRWAPNDDLVARATVEFLAGLGTIESIAIVASDDSFGSGGSAALTAAAEEYGIEITSSDSVNLASVDFAPIVSRIKASEPDAVALWMNAGPMVASFYEQYGESDMASTPLVGQLDFAQPAIADFDLTGYNTAAYNPAIDTPENTAFLELWADDGQDESNALVGWNGYQSILILAAALEDATSIDRAGVRDALEALSYSPTIVGGTVEFDENHQAHDAFVVQQFKGSTTEALTILEQ